jgi:hypothetical protein
MASAHDSGFAASLSGSTPVLQQSVTGDHSGGLHFPSLLGAKPTSVETPKTTFLMWWTAPALRHLSAIGWLRRSAPH